jgi:hypothetical protein
MFRRGVVVVVNAKVAGEAEEEIQTPTLYRHQALSHCGETSKHFNDKWQYRVPSQCQCGTLVVNLHQPPRKLLEGLQEHEIHRP